MEPFLDIKSARLRRLAHAAPNPLMACIWQTAESHAHGFRSLLQNGTPMKSAGMEDLLSFLSESICMSYVFNMTDISFLTESVMGVARDRCCKEIVGIDLPAGCLGNLLTVLRGGAGHGRSKRSDGTESPGTI